MEVFWTVLALVTVISAAGADEPDLVQHVERGEQLLTQGRLDLALKEYETARAAGAGSAMFLNRLGTLYMRASRYGDAADAFKASLREKPGQLPVYSKLGKAYLAAGQLDSAITCVRTALAAAPGVSTIHSSLAFLLLQHDPNDIPEARAHLDTALELDEGNAEAYRYLGYYYTQQDSIPRAIAAYKRVTELAPETLEAYNNLGYLYLQQEDYERALDYYQKALTRAQDPQVIYAINERIATARAMLNGELRARFILVPSRSEAEALLERIRSGADFGALAAKASTAPNADAGGDTGFFGPGELLPDFEDAVLDLKVGEVSDVVELDMGFLIIERMN